MIENGAGVRGGHRDDGMGTPELRRSGGPRPTRQRGAAAHVLERQSRSEPVPLVRERRGAEWGGIRAVRFPEGEAPRPANFAIIQQTFEARGFKGHFASVAFADSRQAGASSDKHVPL